MSGPITVFQIHIIGTVKPSAARGSSLVALIGNITAFIASDGRAFEPVPFRSTGLGADSGLHSYGLPRMSGSGRSISPVMRVWRLSEPPSTSEPGVDEPLLDGT